MGKIKIGMVLDSPFNSDLRVEKEASALTSAGYEVHLLCGRNEGQQKKEIVQDIHVHRAEISMNTRNKGIRDILSSLDFINRPFKRALVNFINEVNPQVLHTHDLPLSKTVRLAAKQYRIPHVLDLHENYPEGLNTWFEWRTSKFIRMKNAAFFGYSKWIKYEKQECQANEYVIAVVDEMKERLQKLHGVDGSKIEVVSNTERVSFKNNFSGANENLLKSGFNITYVGGMGPHRGLDTAIEAMPQIVKSIPHAKLNLVGSGNRDVVQRLKNQAQHLNLQDHIVFHGQKPFEQVIDYMKHSQVNIIPHHSNAHTDNTIPHKLFQILMSEAPLLVSSCEPLKRIVNEFNAGFVFEASNASSFAEAVIGINASPERVAEQCLNGTKAVNEKYNWKLDAERLVNFYQLVLSNQSA